LHKKELRGNKRRKQVKSLSTPQKGGSQYRSGIVTRKSDVYGGQWKKATEKGWGQQETVHEGGVKTNHRRKRKRTAKEDRVRKKKLSRVLPYVRRFENPCKSRQVKKGEERNGGRRW